jgi:hypothetical protein
MTRQENQDLFARKLAALLARTRLRVAGWGLLRTLAVGGPMLVLAVWSAGNPFLMGGALAAGLFLSLAAGLAALSWNQVLAPLWRLRRPRDLVARIEKDGDFANILVAGEESLRLPGRWSGQDAVSLELRARLFHRGVKVLDFLTPDEVARFPHRRATLLAAGLAVVLAVAQAAVYPERTHRGLARLLDPWPRQETPATRGLFAQPGQGHVISGQDIDLAAHDFAAGGGPVVCEIRVGQGLWQPLDARAEPVPWQDAFVPAPYRRWTARLTDVREDFFWRFRRGALVSDARPVSVRHYPLVTEMAGAIIPPPYTGLPEQQLRRLPSWLEVPAGSRLQLTGAVNHPLRKAHLMFGRADSLALDLGGLQVSGTVTVDSTLAFAVVLEDSLGLRNQAPLTYEVAALPDAQPVVQLARPEDDGILPLDGALFLTVEAADDYGLTGLFLQSRVLAADRALAGPAPDLPWQGGPFWDPGFPASAGWETAQGPVAVSVAVQTEGRTSLRVGLGLEVDLAGLELVPGDVLELRVEALDNRRPGSGQRGHSRVLRLVLPSAADMLASQAEASEQRRGELEEMRRRGRELGADLDRLNRELMKNPLPDWARQQEMEAAIQRQKTMQEELARLARELQQDLDRLAAGQMTSEAMLDKAEEVSQLLSQQQGESLNDLLAKLEQADQQASPQEVAQAIREVARNQKDMARRLEAALAMMKRMEQEQDMEGLASLLEQMIRKQQELADLSRQLAEQDRSAEGESSSRENGDTERPEAGPSDADPQDGDQDRTGQEQGEAGEQQGEPEVGAEELARRQEALAEELEQLKQKMEEALAELEEDSEAAGESPSDEQMKQALQQALENLEKQMEQGDMKKASEKLSQMSPEQAAQMQQQALRDLGALYHVILESQSAMQMAMEQHQIGSLRQLAADLLAVSTRQEEIAARIPNQLRDVRSLELTRSQHRLQKATIGVRDRLSLLMDQAPNRIMRLLEKLDDLIEQMGYVVQALEDSRSPVARRDAQAGLAEANRIVIGLLTEAQITSQSSSGGQGNPQQSMAQQLQQMAKEQAELNGLTDQLRQMLANRGLSQETRAQMKRLGEAQGNLGGKLRELEQEERESQNPEGERLLGDLGELGQQMERISGELDDGLVSEETLVRQERILSRLLDARNSVRRRDYTTRRESRTAGELYGQMQGQGDQDQADDPDSVFRLRYQALEKAPLEYRDLVRRYFTALDSLRRLDAGDLPPPEPREGTAGEETP